MALLELLVGVTLFSLVMLLLTAGQASLVQSWGQARRQAHQQDQLLRCQAIMSSQIRSTVSLMGPRTNTRVAGFDGQASQLTFVSSMPARPGGQPGLWLVTYRLEPGSGGGRLVAEERPALDAAYWQGQDYPGRKTVLLSGVQTFKLSYFTWDRRQRGLQERDQWLDRGSGRLPWSVRVEMDLGSRLLGWQLPLACGQ